MFIPLRKKNIFKTKQRLCQYPGCDKEFFTQSPIQKYCDVHTKPEMRHRIKPKMDDISLENRIIKHDYHQVTSMQLICQLEGCGKQYRVPIYPRQFVYPRFCEEHRNEYKRWFFIWNQKGISRAA
jgi:hypothetical protein